MRARIVAAAALALVACKHDSKPAKQQQPAAQPEKDPWGSTAPSAEPKKPQIAKPFLFAVTKPDVPGTTTYLFGTIHIGVDAEQQLPPWVWADLDQAKVFAMEADISDPALLKALQRSDGGTLEADLGPANWKRLQDAIGAKLAAGMNHMKPFAAMTVLATKDLPLTAPMDQVMDQRAVKAGKPVVFLESALHQLEVIDPFVTPPDIVAYLDNLDYARDQTLKMVADYVAGDAAGVAAGFDDQKLWVAAGRDPALFGAYVNAILGERNATWIPEIEKIHAEGGGFVAVGAGHLLGPRNVVQLLEADGYTVTRVAGP